MPGCTSRGGSFSGGSAGFRSIGRDSKTVKRVALAKGFSTINEYLDSLGKNDRSLCKTLTELFQECISDYGNSSRCDNYYKRLSSCPDFDKGKYLQTLDSKEDYINSIEESLQKEAAAKGFSSIDEYTVDRLKKAPGICELLHKIYKECIDRDGTGIFCDYYRESMSEFSCPEFKKGTGSKKKRSS